jgi:type IV pilus assembly protein PilB
MAKAPNRFAGGLAKKPGAAAPAKGAGNGKSPEKPGKGGGGGGGGGDRQRRPTSARKKIGQVMIDLGFINEDQLWQVLDHHRQMSELTGRAAVSLQLISEEQLTLALAEQQGMKVVSLDDEDFRVQEKAVQLVDEAMCQLYKILPVKLDDSGRVLTIAMADPTNLGALDDLRNLLAMDDVVGVVAKPKEIEAAISRYYSGRAESIEDIIKSIQTDEDLMAVGNRAGTIDLETIEEMAEAAPVRKLLNMVLLLGIRDKASDIHFEPFEDEFKMRYRVDGVMYELVPPPRHLAPAIASRIKVMANLDIAERRLPQDGRIELNIGGNPVDLRVSTLPTMFGEGCVLRVLDRTVVSLDLNKIGMPPKILAEFRETIRLPHGICLVTGPTGSGKTTTLYSALNELNEVGVKIITTEDPIEYDIEGIIQSPVNHDIGVTFASLLRAILRQDPDVILVGEIRDFETAQIAVQASLTGHMVFSTLHTNDAPGAVTRLRDMGTQPFLITATVRAILAQRLVRKICMNCREGFNPSPELLMELRLTREIVRDRKFYHGRGCETCNNTGYKGRQGIFELLSMNDEIRELVLQGSTKDQIVAAAKRNGMLPLRDAGLKAIYEGATTIDEVVRETVLDDEM